MFHYHLINLINKGEVKRRHKSINLCKIIWENGGNDTSLFSRIFSWAPVRKRDKLPDTFAWSNKIVYARNVNGDRRIYTLLDSRLILQRLLRVRFSNGHSNSVYWKPWERHHCVDPIVIKSNGATGS